METVPADRVDALLQELHSLIRDSRGGLDDDARQEAFRRIREALTTHVEAARWLLTGRLLDSSRQTLWALCELQRRSGCEPGSWFRVTLAEITDATDGRVKSALASVALRRLRACELLEFTTRMGRYGTRVRLDHGRFRFGGDE